MILRAGQERGDAGQTLLPHLKATLTDEQSSPHGGGGADVMTLLPPRLQEIGGRRVAAAARTSMKFSHCS